MIVRKKSYLRKNYFGLFSGLHEVPPLPYLLYLSILYQDNLGGKMEDPKRYTSGYLTPFLHLGYPRVEYVRYSWQGSWDTRRWGTPGSPRNHLLTAMLNYVASQVALIVSILILTTSLFKALSETFLQLNNHEINQRKKEEMFFTQSQIYIAANFIFFI